MNPELDLLQPYPFERLRNLFADVSPPRDLSPIALSIGEPKHSAPAIVKQAIADNLDKLSNYPATKGSVELRQAIADWCQRRFSLQQLCEDTQVLPVNGTREALFAFTQAVINRQHNPLVISPNPFYQIYEGASLLAGAEPWYLPCDADNNYLPDFSSVPDAIWKRCQMLFICTPGNPSGAVYGLSQLQELITLADRHDFIIASDECYSEIYFDESAPPAGLLQACQAMGREDYARCVVFHSLSKRSNLPGLRSGFVAGDANILKKFLQYRTYHGCAMPVQHQIASMVAWQDEQHVQQNRALYRQKFTAVLDCLSDVMSVQHPDAGFYLWPQLSSSDTEFSRELFRDQHVTVLPGSFLGRQVAGRNPGEQHIRMALVATLEECVEAATRIRHFILDK